MFLRVQEGHLGPWRGCHRQECGSPAGPGIRARAAWVAVGERPHEWGAGEGVGVGTGEGARHLGPGIPKDPEALGLELRAVFTGRGESASGCPGAKQTEGWAGRHRTDEMLGRHKMWTREARSEGEFKGMTGPGILVTGRMRDQGPSRIRKLEGVSQSQGRWRQSDCCHHGVGKVWGVTMDCGPTD